MRSAHFSLLCFLFSHNYSMQAQPFYQRAFGGWVNEGLFCAHGTPDNGVILGGYSGSFVSGTNSADIYLTKFDRQGDLVWSKHYNCGVVSFAMDLANASSLGTIVAGSINHSQGILYRVDASGETLWGRASFLDSYTSVDVTAEDTIYALGYSLTTNSDIQLDKLNGTGTLMWSKRYGTPYADWSGGVKALGDGGAIVSGSTLVGGPNSDGLLMRVSASGELLWSRTYGFADECERFDDVCIAPSGGYLAVGEGCYSNSWGLVLRVNEEGDTLWTQRYHMFSPEVRFTTVEALSDGFLIGGVSNFLQPVLLKIDENGGILWQRNVSVELETPYQSVLTHFTDGSLALASTAMINGPGSSDFFLMVTDAQGQGATCLVDTERMDPDVGTWQLGNYGTYLGAGSLNFLDPEANDAATLLETVCGNVNVEAQAIHDPLFIYDAVLGSMTLRDVAPGDMLSVWDVLGRPLGSWRSCTNTLQVPVGSLTSGPLFFTLLDSQGRTRYTRKIMALRTE